MVVSAVPRQKERITHVVIPLDRATFSALAQVARESVRSPDQQAEFLIRQALSGQGVTHA